MFILLSKYFYIVSINILESYYIMAKTRKRQIKQRGGAECIDYLKSIIDSINILIKAIVRVKIKEFEKIKEININFYTNVANAFDSQINASCTDIKKSDYASLINRLDALSAKFAGKQEVFSQDTRIYLTRIETMKTRASELSELIIEPSVSLPNSPQVKSKTVKKKTPIKVDKIINVMPPQPPTLLQSPTLSSVSAATAEEKADKEAKKNAEKKARRATRNAAEKADEEARKAAAEEATRKKIAKTIANEAASKIAAKNANEAAKEEAIKVANEYIKIAAKNAEKKINNKATVQMLEERDKKKAAEEEAAKKAAEEARINDITESNIELFFEEFISTQIIPHGIITRKQANKYVTTLFPNVKFTDKITDSTPTQTKITQPDSESYMYYSYLYMIYIGILNNYLHILTKNNPYDLFARIKLIFKGGRAAQIMLPKGSNLLSDDTDIFIQSTNIEHTPFFLKTFALQLAKSWSNPQLITFRIGKENSNIVKIAYRGSTGYIPISDIDFGSPTYPHYYNDIRMVHNTWNTNPKQASTNISLHLVYYHQSPKSFFAEKQFIYDMYLNPIYKTCDCGVVPHTEDCIASCSERQFYLDKFKKYVDVKTTQSSSNRKTQKNKSVSSL
jgi:chemotaxis protein histidine kinase CheA